MDNVILKEIVLVILDGVENIVQRQFVIFLVMKLMEYVLHRINVVVLLDGDQDLIQIVIFN
jgi:hypothetical protein